MNSKEVEFWDKTVNKMFWLGTALAGAIAVNALVMYNQGRRKSDKKSFNQGDDFHKQNQAGDDIDHETLSGTRKGSKRKVQFEEFHGGEISSPTNLGPNESAYNTVRKQISKEQFDAIEVTNPRRKASIDVHTGGLGRTINTNVYTIAFTGGPCAGKTTAISYCAEKLKELGYPAICVSEAATLIFSSGGVLNMETYTPYQGIEFQKNLMKLQMSLEDIFTKIVQINTNQTCFVLCDRGLMDGSAYLSPEQWDVLLNELGLYEQDIKDYRYDLVIHLTTAADGAEAFYHVDNNKARSEDVQAAIDLDKKVR